MGVRDSKRGRAIEEHEQLNDPRDEIRRVYGDPDQLERERLEATRTAVVRQWFELSQDEIDVGRAVLQTTLGVAARPWEPAHRHAAQRVLDKLGRAKGMQSS